MCFSPFSGTRRDLPDYKKCNLGKVKANAIVTRGGYGYNETQINAYMNLFTYAQQYYGRKDADAFSFSMFYSMPPYHDLIFQDATQQLRSVPQSQRRYDLYLGGDFMRAKRITDCDSGAMPHKFSISLAIIIPLIVASAFTYFWTCLKVISHKINCNCKSQFWPNCANRNSVFNHRVNHFAQFYCFESLRMPSIRNYLKIPSNANTQPKKGKKMKVLVTKNTVPLNRNQ